MQYARLPHKDINRLRTEDKIIYSVGRIKAKNSGVGPMIAMSLNYNMMSSFNLFLDTSLSYLSTWSTFSTTGFTKDTPLPPSTSKTVNREKLNSKVTEIGFDGKIGASYDYTMQEGQLSLRVGWEVLDFDHSWSGLFFGAKWLGNMQHH